MTAKLPTLPFHLMLAGTGYMSSIIGSGLANNAWLRLNPNAPNGKQQNNQALHLQQAVAKEARRQTNALLGGLKRYHSTDYKRTLTEPPVIWRQGPARLLDYGVLCDTPNPTPHVLIIPSLINRYYVLDLEEQHSLVRYLASRGIYPLMLDWGEPGKQETAYDCNDYITGPLANALDFITSTTGKPIVLAGYCMGGVLATALAQLKSHQVSALAVLAAPWDFANNDMLHPRLPAAVLTELEKFIMAEKTVPPEWIQTLFYMANPWMFAQKFRKFYNMREDSPSFQEFMALEHWVNDGVPISARVVSDCLIDWSQHNILARKKWRIGDSIIDPTTFTIPTFAAVPKNDVIVPTGCAQPLADALPYSTQVTPNAGHVGMIVGSRAKQELWEPLAKWLSALR